MGSAIILLFRFIIYITFIFFSSIFYSFNYYYDIEFVVISPSSGYISSSLTVIRAVRLLILLTISRFVISKDACGRIDFRFLQPRRCLVSLLLFLHCFLQKRYTRYIFSYLLLINRKIRVL